MRMLVNNYLLVILMLAPIPYVLLKETPKECGIVLLQKENDSHCLKERRRNLLFQKQFFQITKPEDHTIYETNANSIGFHKILPTVPWLNRSKEEMVAYYSFNDEDSRYMGMFAAYINFLKTVEKKVRDTFFIALRNTTDVPSFQFYERINRAFDGSVKKLNTLYVSNPCHNKECLKETSQQYNPLDDEMFVQRRLAGPCPFNLKQVSTNGPTGILLSTLKRKMNLDFDYDQALTRALGKRTTLAKAVNNGLVFVLYHPEIDHITASSPFSDPAQERTFRKMNNPIVFFILTDDGFLKIVSIQRDSEKDSEVLQPIESDPEEWLKVKGDAEMADSNYCQGFYHSGKIHLVSTIYCLAYRRHIDKNHPLYDFFLYHCEGTVPHISLVYHTLLTSNERSDASLGMGHQGFLQLGTKAFNSRMYGELDLPFFLKRKGLDNKRIKYYPFRDDAEVLWEELAGFTNDVISEIYKTDDEVSQDPSLQSFATELSSKDAGNMAGFPTYFESKQSIRLFLLRFLWFNVIHTSLNYPLNMHSQTFSPTKSYQNIQREPFSTYLQTLPDLYTAV
eukprot:TCONS_00053029-protein